MLDSFHESFVRSVAPASANLILLLETALGFALLIGAVLARQRRFLAHAWCQSAVVLLNSAIIVLFMVPSLRLHLVPKIPAKLDKPYYALATAHAALGSVAEAAGLYILLAAGTRILPPRFRLKNYKVWMRSALALWWLTLVLGWMTYVRWYVPRR